MSEPSQRRPLYAPPDIEEQRPDWVMCGIPWAEDGKVGIIASTELDRAELEARRERLDVYLFEAPPVRMRLVRYTLRVEMQGFVIVVADTYEQAFRSLFERWSPQRQAPGQLESS